MPQMSLLMWFSLFIMFSTVLVLFNVMYYCLTQYKPSIKKYSTESFH